MRSADIIKISIVAIVALIILSMNTPVAYVDTSTNTISGLPISDPLTFYEDATTPWWNYTYHYRVKITITEVNGYDRTNEPVTVSLSFDNGHARVNSLRVVDNNGNLIPSQVSDATYYSGNTYYASVKLTFPVNITASSSVDYYVYYTDQAVESPTYSSQLQANFDGTTLTVSNGKYQLTMEEGKCAYNLVIGSRDYFTDLSLSPVQTGLEPLYSEYVYVSAGDDFRIIAWHDNTFVRVVNASSGEELENATLDEGEYIYHSSYSYTVLLKIEANNTVSFYLYDGTDDVWEYAGSHLYTFVTTYLAISTYEPAYVKIYDLTDNNDNFNLELAANGTWYTSAFDSDVVKIVANTTITIMGGSIEGLSSSTWSGPETFRVNYGVNQTFYRIFVAPEDGRDGYVGIMAIEDNTAVTVRFTNNGSLIWSGTLNHFDVKSLSIDGGWVDVKGSKPIAVTSGQHQDDEDPDVSAFQLLGSEYYGTSRLFYIVNPEKASMTTTNMAIHIDALYPNTHVYFTTNESTSDLYLDQWEHYQYNLAPERGVRIYSNYPITVRATFSGSQEEALLVLQKPPRIVEITEIEKGSVFAKYRVEWNRTGTLMNSTQYYTFYYGYPLWNVTNVIWFADTSADIQYSSFDAVQLRVDPLINLPNLFAFAMDKQIQDNTEVNIHARTIASDYVIGWDSDNTYSGMAIGLVMKSFAVHHPPPPNEFEPTYSKWELRGGLSISSGHYDAWIRVFYVTSINSYDARFELNYYILAGDGFSTAAQLNAVCMSVKYLLSYSKGSEEQLFRLQVHVHDYENDAVVNANVTLYRPNGAKFGSQLTDSTGNATFENLPDTGTYHITVSFVTDYNNIEVHKDAYVTFTSSDVGVIKNVSIEIPMGNLQIYIKDMRDDPVTGTDATVKFYNKSNLQLLYSASPDSNGYITLNDFPGLNYTINSTYNPRAYTFAHGDLNFNETKSITLVQSINTITFNIQSYDNKVLSNVKVTITHSGTTHIYLDYTNSTGNVTFVRVLTGSWTVNFEFTNAYSQKITNSTSFSLTNNASASILFKLQVKNMVVYVHDQNNNPVESADVKVNQTGTNNMIAHGTTNSSGYITFEFIDVNTKYDLNVTMLSTNTTYVDLKINSTPLIVELTITFGKKDTILKTDNSTIIEVYYGDNITIAVQFLNRTTGQPDQPVPDQNITLLEYTISCDNNILDHQQFQSNYLSPGNYYFIINTSVQKLNVTKTYLITIHGETDPTYNDPPTNITIALIVKPTPTSQEGLPTSISIEWSRNVTLLVNFTDTIHNLKLSGGTVRCYITAGQYHYLLDMINGTYYLNINTSDPSGLNLAAGDYTLYFEFKKFNYVNKTYSVTLHVTTKATSLSVLQGATINVNWSNLFVINVSYTSYGSALDGAIVNASWGSTIYTTPVYSNGYYCFVINSADVPAGTHEIMIKAFLGNYTYKTMNITINVLELETTYSMETPTVFIVNWTDLVTINVTFFDVNHSIGILGAAVNTNWTSGHWQYTYVGNGKYMLVINTEIEPKNYTLEIVMSKDNYQSKTVYVEIRILIPVSVLYVNGGSSDAPISVYWNENFTMSLIMKNSYSNVTLTDVTVTYNWTNVASGLITVSGEFYNVTFNSTSAGNVGAYIITVEIHRNGVTPTIIYVYINIKAIPTQIVNYNESEYNLHFADNLTLVIGWRDTLHDVAVTLPDTLTVSIKTESGVVYDNLTAYISYNNGNYTIFVDTKNLHLNSTLTYYLEFSIMKTGYSTPQSIIILLHVASTAIDVDFAIDSPIYWSYNFTIVVNVSDTVHNLYLNGVTVNATIGSVTYTMTDLGNGTYILTLNSTDLGVGTHLLEITAIKANYVTRIRSTQVIISEIPTRLEVTTNPTNLTIVIGLTNITIQVFYYNNLTNDPIQNATVKLIIGETEYIFTEVPEEGYYILNLQLENFTVGEFDLRIIAVKGNYTEQEITLRMKIEEQTIVILGVRIPVSQIYYTGGGALVAITIFAVSVYVYRLYKIPFIIRITDKAIKMLTKGKIPEFDKFPTYNDVFNEVIGPLFSPLQLPEIPKKELLEEEVA